jgi:hypothetical protein
MRQPLDNSSQGSRVHADTLEAYQTQEAFGGRQVSPSVHFERHRWRMHRRDGRASRFGATRFPLMEIEPRITGVPPSSSLSLSCMTLMPWCQTSWAALDVLTFHTDSFSPGFTSSHWLNWRYIPLFQRIADESSSQQPRWVFMTAARQVRGSPGQRQAADCPWHKNSENGHGFLARTPACPLSAFSLLVMT